MTTPTRNYVVQKNEILIVYELEKFRVDILELKMEHYNL
jgi:hypothetical protein